MRFGFGKNWKSYIQSLTPESIAESRKAIAESLGRSELNDLRILDIGSGSGLSSLAFLEMGADVTAFDYDQDSVECTISLLNAKAPHESKWRALQGSVLDIEFMQSLGKFDLVYSWGVLHHTGAMWQAMDNAAMAAKDSGTLLIALYNDQGLLSKFWKAVKWTFCSSWLGRLVVKTIFYPLFFAFSIFKDFKNSEVPMSHIRNYYLNRGMSIVHDWDDWLGGYPFEAASTDAVESWAVKRGFAIRITRATKGLGCNEFVFHKDKINT